jgi:hypothetical protein
MERRKRFVVRSALGKKTFCLLFLLLAGAVLGVVELGKTASVKATDNASAPSFDMTMQLNVYSIDLKTETLYSQYYHFQMWTSDPTVSAFDVVILQPDYYGGVELPSSNASGNQQVIYSINSDQPDVNAWRWRLNPIRPFILGGTPWDQYEISFLIAVNMSTQLNINNGFVWMPAYLQDEWAYSEDIAAQKLAARPSNQTLTSLGLSPQKFYQYGLDTMPDFYLFTVTLSYPSMNSWRTSIAFFLPSVAILAVLIVATVKRKRLKRTDFLGIFVGAGLFTLSFLVSFYQFAPPDVFTWQEVFLIVDFVFAAGLAVYSLVRVDKSGSDNSDKTQTQKPEIENEKKMLKTKETHEEQGQERRLAEIAMSIDKAFEWLVLLMTVLLGILFTFLTWVTKPEMNLDVTAKFMFSLTMPLILAICTWLWHLMTLSEGRKISLRLSSWGILSMVFAYYVMLFFTFVAFGVTRQFTLIAAVALSSGSAIVSLFPSKRILRAYRAMTPGNEFWNRWHAPVGAYLFGVCFAAILILMPFLLP